MEALCDPLSEAGCSCSPGLPKGASFLRVLELTVTVMLEETVVVVELEHLVPVRVVQTTKAVDLQNFLQRILVALNSQGMNI